MKSAIKSAVVLAMLGSSALSAQTSQSPDAATSAQATALDAILSRDAVWGTPVSAGCSVGVAQDGHTIFNRGYGMANLEHGVPNTAETLFDPGSIAKSFTAAAVLLLAQDGRISLTDDIRRYLPEMPDYGNVITIDNLLLHTSGIRDWGSLANVIGLPRTYRVYTNLDILDLLSMQHSLNFRPGTHFSYTNSEFVLLALIVERVSGKSFQEFARERVFTPLGMTSTFFRQSYGETVRNQSLGYAKTRRGFRRAIPLDEISGPSGVITSTGDLLAWNEALNNRRLGDAVTARLQERGTLAGGRRLTYSRGLVNFRYRNGDQIGHGGLTTGYTAWTGRYLPARLSIALLCNSANPDADLLARKIIDVFLPPAPAAAPASAAPTPGAPGRAGLYINQGNGMPLTIVNEGGRLRLEDGPFLTPAAGGRLSDGFDEYAFTRPGEFELHTFDGDSASYRRVEPMTAIPAGELAAYAGRYRSDDLDVNYDVTVENGQLKMKLEHRSEVSYGLQPLYRDAFANDGFVYSFHRNAAGAVTGLSFRHDRVWDLPLRRVSDNH